MILLLLILGVCKALFDLAVGDVQEETSSEITFTTTQTNPKPKPKEKSPVRKLKLGPIYLTFVLRHRWEKDRSISNYTVWKMRKRFNLGIWFSKQKVVGTAKKTIKKTFGKSNLVHEYMFGVNLIVCSMWVTIKFKPTMSINLG